MSMASQVQANTSTRQFTEAEIKRYFSKVPRGAIVTAIIGALALLIGLPSQSGFFIVVGIVYSL